MENFAMFLSFCAKLAQISFLKWSTTDYSNNYDMMSQIFSWIGFLKIVKIPFTVLSINQPRDVVAIMQ